MNIKYRYLVIIVLSCLVGVLFFIRKENKKQLFTAQGEVWTTEYHITYEASKNLDDSIAAVLDMVDKSASAYNPQSLVSQFNATGEVAADGIIMLLMRESRVVNEQSGGLYDPTVMPLVGAWKKVRKQGGMLSQQEIDSLVALVGLDKVMASGNKLVAMSKGVQLDFSSIAKGLACDEVGRMLERNGAKNYLVEIGGEVVARGINSHGEKWHVSVDLPTDQAETTSHESMLVLELNNESVATSGNYRQYAEVDGKRVTHIVNPRTGLAEQSDLLSVSIIAPTCATADAWATACMVMGTDATQQMMDKRTDLGVLTISADSAGNYVVWSNKAFAEKVAK